MEAGGKGRFVFCVYIIDVQFMLDEVQVSPSAVGTSLLATLEAFLFQFKLVIDHSLA